MSLSILLHRVMGCYTMGGLRISVSVSHLKYNPQKDVRTSSWVSGSHVMPVSQ